MSKSKHGKSSPLQRPYVYEPIDLTKREIRLVKIKPFNGRKRVECSLITVSLTDSPEFQALFYVWGDVGATKCILLDHRLIYVTTNLAAALKRLQSKDYERIIWIDALCIDQSNTKERNHQVMLMKDIYSTATVVNIWVGERKNQNDLALDTITGVSENKEAHLDLFFQSNIYSMTSSERRFNAILAFFSRPGWHRVWTVQETVLAQKLVFFCGDRSMDGDLILSATGIFLNHMGSCCKRLMFSDVGFFRSTDLNGILYQLDHLQVLRQPDITANLPAVMMGFRQRRCSDHRDKIYGYLGLVHEDSLDELRPDYSVTVCDVG